MQNFIQSSIVVTPEPPTPGGSTGYQVVVERIVANPPYVQFGIDAGSDPLIAGRILNIYLENQKDDGYTVISDTEKPGRYLMSRGDVLFHVWIDPALPEGVSV